MPISHRAGQHSIMSSRLPGSILGKYMTKRRIANLTSNLLNPFLVSLGIILLLSFEATSSPFDALKWTLIFAAISILPVFLVTVYLVRNERLEGIFINIRRQRNKIYLLASFCAVAGCIVILYLGAPLVLVVSLVAGLSAMIVFTCINLLWKISVHTAFVAASVTVVIILYGSIGTVTAVLIPPIAWSRIELEHHSITQVVAGALLAALIVVVVFYLFGLISF